MRFFKLALLILLVWTSTVSAQTILATTTTCTDATIKDGTAGCAIANVAGQGSLGIQITGTWTGTLTFSTSIGTSTNSTFVSALVTPVGSTTPVTTTTGNGVWSIPVAGFAQVKVAVTITGTGSAIVVFRSTNQARNNNSGGGSPGSGTVTSVGLTAPAIFNISGSPVTTTGTLGIQADNPGSDRLVFYDFSGTNLGYLTVGSGLNITGTTITASGGPGAPSDATYITQVLSSGLSAEQALASLATGILKSTTTTGVVSIAASSDVISIWTGTCDNTSVLGADGICYVIDSGFDIIESGTNTTADMVIGSGATLTVESNIDIGSAGVRLSNDGDGAIIFTGLSSGADESLTFNFDDTPDIISISSSSGVYQVDWAGLSFYSQYTANIASGIGLQQDVLGEANYIAAIIGSGNYSTATDDATATIYGVVASAGRTGAGDVGDVVAINTLAYSNSAGSISRLISILIDSPSIAGGGAITSGYGILINDQTVSGATNNYALFYDGPGALNTSISMNGIITGQYISNGTTPSVANVGANSCGTDAATIAGNSNSGRVTVGATSGTQCRVTTTITAPNGWQCSVSNTTTAALARCVGVDTTHFDLLGVFTAADVLSYVALPN